MTRVSETRVSETRVSDTPSGDQVRALLERSGFGARLEPDPAQSRALAEGRAALEDLPRERSVYGVTHGFGPLVDHRADAAPGPQGIGLVHHLAVGQGEPLSPEVTRTMVWLRLRGMLLGHSAVSPEIWTALAQQWNAGFTPVVPREGSLSASGDLVPLAHAALAAAAPPGDRAERPPGAPGTEPGAGADVPVPGDSPFIRASGARAWRRGAQGWEQMPAGAALAAHGLAPVHWEARSALAFVNGSSACLASALHNHRELTALARAAAGTTARLASLLGASAEAYDDALSRVRNQPGQRTAARWIRAGLTARPLPDGPGGGPARPLQERYSLRCAPQIVGAVLDQLEAQGAVLLDEAAGCSDNPVFVDGRLLHGGNFHAAPVALVCDSHGSSLHQLAFLLERQLALVVDPAVNGGLPPLLAPRPGAGSGLAGVQIAASSHLARIRQLAHPASLTALPTNLHNQDHVPMALNGANAVSDMLSRAWWILGSLLVALNQAGHLLAPGTGGQEPRPGLWGLLAHRFPALDRDRPLAAEVVSAAALGRRHFLGDTGDGGTRAAADDAAGAGA
ncbi:aromatic amino acid ammonia-lyase [Streptomyces yaizuensis]|uniref:Aromatic amino acid ammonia-lyase n=1 Tax=Streptomyces yaizuensis TaxID=2989713 RepID=A0ABQ5P381_9ACTN|nr:aromatic amino acid ammonia-lyase [Streptomyces sp. YSPA8]GLF97030.1 aromatic amino acid ammonia-lyase [Streptomyces sp. YSPA8]